MEVSEPVCREPEVVIPDLRHEVPVVADCDLLRPPRCARILRRRVDPVDVAIYEESARDLGSRRANRILVLLFVASERCKFSDFDLGLMIALGFLLSAWAYNRVQRHHRGDQMVV
jgi:hypothetical protein